MANVVKEVLVNAPIERVYEFWRNFENFPRFMDNIESIESTGPDLSHWKMKGPLGKTIEWDAKTTSAQENKKIAWQSVRGDIETHGAVTFESQGEQTKVTVGLGIYASRRRCRRSCRQADFQSGNPVGRRFGSLQKSRRKRRFFHPDQRRARRERRFLYQHGHHRAARRRDRHWFGFGRRPEQRHAQHFVNSRV